MKLRIVEKSEINLSTNKIMWTKFIPQIRRFFVWGTLARTYDKIDTKKGDKRFFYKREAWDSIGWGYTKIDTKSLNEAEDELSQYLSQLGLDLVIEYKTTKKIHKYSVSKDKKLIKK